MSLSIKSLGLGLVGLAAAATQGPAVTVDVNTKYQSFDGIGVAEAFQRSLVLHELNTASQKLALDYLFDNKKGAGFTILRNGIGSAKTDPFDLMKSIAPVAPKSNSSELNFIPLPRDDEYQVWLSKQAIARGVKNIYADAWSADAYMKTNNNDSNGGFICGVYNTSCATGDWRQSYANKLVKYVKDYAAQGITVDYLGFLNEPDLITPYASMQSNGQQAADFLEVLSPTLKAAGLKTKIACCDGSGWEQNRDVLTGIQAAGAEKYVDLVTSHGYSSRPGTPFSTTRKTWITEWSTFDALNYNWYTTGGSQSDGLTWANNIQQSFSVSNVTGFLYWWGAANATDNESLLFVNGTSEVKVTKRLWAHAHFGSRFIRPGANRVAAAVAGGSNLNVTAFANTDGTVAIQIINNGDVQQKVNLGGLPQTYGRRPSVNTFLTNNANNLTQNAADQSSTGYAVFVPARSLLSAYVSPGR